MKVVFKKNFILHTKVVDFSDGPMKVINKNINIKVDDEYELDNIVENDNGTFDIHFKDNTIGVADNVDKDYFDIDKPKRRMKGCGGCGKKK